MLLLLSTVLPGDIAIQCLVQYSETIDLLGVSSLQAQVKELQVHNEENQRLDDLLSVRDKELNELEESISILRQQLQGHFTHLMLMHSFVVDLHVHTCFQIIIICICYLMCVMSSS